MRNELSSRPKRQSQLEDVFLRLWLAVCPNEPRPVRQYQFAKDDGRKWAFDFAWVEKKVAVELDGGGFVRGGHSRGLQMQKDREKDREAVKMGWKVLRYVGLDLREKPVQVVEEVAWLLSVV